jgi:hypothetical protein
MNMPDTPDPWKRLDIVLKTLIAALGVWVTITYHRSQSNAEAGQRQLDELRVVKEFFDPLTSADPDQRRMAAAVIGQLANRDLVFRLATALPDNERGEVLAVYGSKEVQKVADDDKQPFDSRQNAQAALDALNRGEETWSRPIPPPLPPSSSAPLSPLASPTMNDMRGSSPVSAFVYIGHWDHQSQVWVTHYLEPTDTKPLGAPGQLTVHPTLAVRPRTGAVYLRTDIPDADGNNRPSKGILHEGQIVTLEQAPLYNNGVSDSGFIWARVRTR